MKPDYLTPLKAIRQKCLDCCCGKINEVRLCVCEECTLYPYRMGHNPYKQPRSLTEEEIRVRSENLRKWKEQNQRGKL